MTAPFDFAAAAGIPKTKAGTPDFAAAAGIPTTQGSGMNTGPAEAAQQLFQRAAAKLKAGKTLTPLEAEAIARAQASERNLAGVAWAIQPLQFLSDITKGLIGEAQGTGGSAARGVQAAGSHLSYGLAEKLPGMAGAASRGVSGAELLKGTKYAKDPTAAMLVEVFADPSTLLTGAGFVVKSAAMAGRLTRLESLAKTAGGAERIRDILKTANTVGEKLIVAGDEITGVPAAVRGAAKTKLAQAAKRKLSKLADTQLPDIPGAAAIRREGGGTIGDAFLTPDQKASIYTPEQLARDEFRTGVRQSVDNTVTGIKGAAQADAKVAAAVTKGLKPADATEVNRLLGVFTTATDPGVAAEALRRLGVISTRVGKNLEPKFVAAVKAVDRVGQQTLGAQLKAEGLPAVIDPAVTKAIQAAQTGADLLPHVGAYRTVDGRPRGILMTQYVGRGDVPATIAKLGDLPEIPAVMRVDEPRVAGALDAAPKPEVPPTPIEPVGVVGRGEVPVNPASAAERVTASPVNQTPPFVQGAAKAPSEARSPADVLEELFTGRAAQSPGTVPVQAAAPTNTAAQARDFTPAPRTPSQVLDDLLTPPAAARPEPTTLPSAAQPPAPASSAPVLAARAEPPSAIVSDPTPTPAPLPTPKTPQSVLGDLLAPPKADPLTVLPTAGMRPTEQAITKPIALPAAAPPERMVMKAVPTTYRTVQADANALDWASLPDDGTRRAVLNAIPDARNGRFVRDAQRALRLDRSNITVPLGHPTVGRYFPDDALMDAQRQGTELGELTVVNRVQVPQWYDPKGPPLEVQRGLHEQAVKEAGEAAFPNQYAAAMSLRDAHDDTSWIIGDAFADYERVAKPDLVNTRAAGNAYAQRVAQYAGRPATKGEVFQYRLQLARYRQARNLGNLTGEEVARHLGEFYRANPDATLYDGVLSAARAFDVGRVGAKHMQGVLKRSEAGVMRDLSPLEKREFGQYLMREDGKVRGTGAGLLVDRLKRNPEGVSQEFEQVFAQDVNALRLVDEQVRTRSAAIVKAQTFREYRSYLENTGQLISGRKLEELRRTPESRLTPDQLAMRDNASRAITRPGEGAGWYVVDSEIPGYFQKGDVIPWWAAFDLMPAKVMDDAGVAIATLKRGGLDVYNRLWSAMNARLLGSVSSVVNDQIGQFLQMALWGVTPDQIIEGAIQRAAAGASRAGQAEMKLMRESGIHSATLEANLGAGREELTRLAARLDGDTDMTRMQRVIDRVIRFAERGSGIDRGAMTGVAGGVADVAGFGSAYVFQLRSALSDLQRESLWFHRRAMGDTPAQAARYANDVLMDMRLVPAYARVVRKAWPFFNWIAMSYPRSIVTILRKPGINAAYQRLPQASDNSDDPKDNARRVLARDGGWINLGTDDPQTGARVYLDPKNWSPVNTIPQLIDWRNTTVGPVDLPWYLNLVQTVQGGTDRFGRNIYASVLDGGSGGYAEAAEKDAAKTRLIVAKTVAAQFNPSYAPGSSRAQQLARSIIAAGRLPQDGSKDLAIAHTLTSTGWGRAWLAYMQNGVTAPLERDPLGTRESPYSLPAPGMDVALGSFVLPLKEVNADQDVQGNAMQALSVGQLEFQSWQAAQKRRLAELEAGGASPERLRVEENRVQQEAERRAARLDMLDTLTR